MTTDKGNDLRALIDQQEPGFMQKALAATAVARPTTDNETVLREALGRCVAALKEAHYTGHEVNGHEMHDAAILAGVEALSRPASAPEGVVESKVKIDERCLESEARLRAAYVTQQDDAPDQFALVQRRDIGNVLHNLIRHRAGHVLLSDRLAVSVDEGERLG